MKQRRITIIQGHPDPAGGHLCHALAAAYQQGCNSGGHESQMIDVAQLDFPILRSAEEFQNGEVCESIESAQNAIQWANHLVVIYPLWMGTMPALLKAFFEQSFRHHFAMEIGPGNKWERKLKGRSARIVITMGMPALAYRWYFGAHSLKSLEKNILGFCGIGPIRETLFGMVEAVEDNRRKKWITKMEKLGTGGA